MCLGSTPGDSQAGHSYGHPCQSSLHSDLFSVCPAKQNLNGTFKSRFRNVWHSSIIGYVGDINMVEVYQTIGNSIDMENEKGEV